MHPHPGCRWVTTLPNRYRGQIAADLKPIYRAPSREAAWAAFEEFEEKWAKPYPAIGQLWRNAWEQFVPFLDYDVEIRTAVVRPLATSESTMVSTPPRRRCRFLTMTGSKVASRSRGTSIWTGLGDPDRDRHRLRARSPRPCRAPSAPGAARVHAHPRRGRRPRHHPRDGGLFFTDDLSLWWLGAAMILLLLVVLGRRAGVRNLVFYVLLAAAVWLAVFESGCTRRWPGGARVLDPAVADRDRDDTAAFISEDLVEILEDDREINDAALIHTAHQASRGVSPLARVEEALQPYSAYLILPLFAPANAGVSVSVSVSVSGFGDAMSNAVGLGIFLGLVVGAPVGGMLLAYASVRVGPGRMPENLDWPAIGGVALLKGIGFTIAIFITTLAFEDRALQDTATLAVLAASLLSALIGLAVIFTRHALLTQAPANNH